MSNCRTTRCDRIGSRQISAESSSRSILRWNDGQYRLIMPGCSLYSCVVMVGVLFGQDITEIRENDSKRRGSNDCKGESMAEEYG